VNVTDRVEAVVPVADLEDGRRARLWTPERVPLTLPLAGLGERALAYLIDLSVLLAAGAALFFIYNVWGDFAHDVGGMSALGTLLFGLAVFGAAVAYDVVCEVAFSGRTVGKRAVKLRVLRSSGKTPDVFTSILRNAIRLLDILPIGYGVGIVAIFFTGTRRLGDLVADTFVVTERSRRADPLATCRTASTTASTPTPPVFSRSPWSDDDALRALSMVERTAKLDKKLADDLCARLLRKLEPTALMSSTNQGARALLAAYCVKLANDRAGVLAQVARLVDAEQTLARSLDALSTRNCPPSAVEAADAAIRRAASELMRAGRRGVPARHRESLSLALLDAERRRTVRDPLLRSLARYLLREVPATVWSERKLVARSGAVLAFGLVVGGIVAYGDAGVARFLVGDDVARQIEQGAAWTDNIAKNNQFAEASVQIIFNNIGVGLRVFVYGLLGGVATILGLLSNGVQIGATFGYALKLGTAGTLLRFVCAHGPVELTMVAVAGAAGMCLGRALLSPGSRTRLQALREEGARGVRLVVAASIGFLCIGTVEGFISPGQMFPTPVSLSIGLTLLAIFWTWVVAYGRNVSRAAR
jgi:uncharacterized membrane protein SpoIIM required for sporulation/uncharacterized RDD family membrane protein YckC